MNTQVLKLDNNKLVPIEFGNFVRLTVREAVNGEYLLHVGRAYVATGDVTYLTALRKNTLPTVFFHELIAVLLPHWSSSLMDMRIVDLPIVPLSGKRNEQLENAVKNVKETFEGAEVVN